MTVLKVGDWPPTFTRWDPTTTRTTTAGSVLDRADGLELLLWGVRHPGVKGHPHKSATSVQGTVGSRATAPPVARATALSGPAHR